MRNIVRPGELRHSVTIQTESTTQNTYGEYPDTWSDVATVRAKIDPVRGKEYLAERHAQGETTYKVMARHHAGFVQKNRLKFGSRYLYIEAVMDIEERGRYIEAICVERNV